jgi:hypothetical protein
MTANQSSIRQVLSHPAIGLLIALAVSIVFCSLTIAGIINATLAYVLLFIGWIVSIAVCYVGHPILSLTKKAVIVYAIFVSAFFCGYWRRGMVVQTQRNGERPKIANCGHKGRT